LSAFAKLEALSFITFDVQRNLSFRYCRIACRSFIHAVVGGTISDRRLSACCSISYLTAGLVSCGSPIEARFVNTLASIQ
jgi:hypothetical protein